MVSCGKLGKDARAYVNNDFEDDEREHGFLLHAYYAHALGVDVSDAAVLN
jgi:hypothetical protein